MSTAPVSRLLILDDHDVVRLGYEHAVSKDASLKIAGSYASSKALLAALWEGVQADMLLMDYALGANEIDGINLVAMLRAKRPAMKILVVSAHDSASIVSLVMRAGAHGFFSKSESLDGLLPALHRIRQGLAVTPAGVATALAGMPAGAGSPYRPEAGMSSVLENLSPREHEVLRCLMDGMSISAIALKFSRSVKTVSNQKQSAFKKLGVTSVPGLLALRGKVDRP